MMAKSHPKLHPKSHLKPFSIGFKNWVGTLVAKSHPESVCLFVQTAEMVVMTHVEFDGQRPVELEIPSCTFVLLEIPMCKEIPSRYQAAPQGPRIPPKPSKYPSECHNGI